MKNLFYVLVILLVILISFLYLDDRGKVMILLAVVVNIAINELMEYELEKEYQGNKVSNTQEQLAISGATSGIVGYAFGL